MKKTLTLFAAAAALIVACNHENVPTPVTTTGAPGVVPNAEAIQQLTTAQCGRARDCNEIGGRHKYADEEACRREYHHDLQADLRPNECPGGIREHKLSNCLQEIHNSKCGNLIDRISRITTCRSGAMCID